MNNEVLIVGITKDENCVEVARPSGIVDQVPVNVPSNVVGKRISLKGELLSANTYDRKLKLCVYPTEIVESIDTDINKIHLEGFLCKNPNYRITPAGRHITDLLIAVHHGRESSYLPCIYWGDASDLNIGDMVSIDGRIQSREYLKNDIIHTVYEVSIEQLNTM